jgi:hypothetical protein
VKASYLLPFLRHSLGAMTYETAYPFIGCRAHSALMGDGGTCLFLSSDPPDPTSLPSERSTQLLLGKGAATHQADSCWQWGRRWRGSVGALIRGWPVWSPGTLIEIDRGFMHWQRWAFFN